MKNWFTVEKADADTYIISEYGHEEETHAYLVCGTERAALIDTGLGVGNIAEVVSALTALPILVLTTHVHWDHIGGHKYFKNIAVHEAEKAWLCDGFPLPSAVVKENLMRGMKVFPTGFLIEDYRVFRGNPSRILHDGDRIDLGRRTLAVIHTPGHSPGHCCFYERARKHLYSGDLIYSGRLDAFYPTTDPTAFYTSVKKLRALPVSRMFPAHHTLALSPTLVKRVENAFEMLLTQRKRALQIQIQI